MGVKVQKWYWWAKGWVMDNKGRQRELILGSFDSEVECRDEAYRIFIGEADVRSLPTRNEQRASHYFRHAKMESGSSPADALERFRHHGNDIGIE